MSGSVNKVILVGNLGKDPDIRTTQDGNKIVSFSVATTESWRDKNTGEQKGSTQWHNVVIFSPGIAGIAEQYLKKGAKVYIEGALQTRKWQDQNGQERYTTEVVLKGFNSSLTMLGGKGSSSEYEQYSQDAPQSEMTQTQAPAGGASNIDDEIPF